MVVMDNIIKDIDEDCFDFWVFQDNLESLFYLFGISGIIYVKEVGWFVFGKFDDIYSCYGQFCIIYYVIYVVVQLNVIQIVFFGFYFGWVFFIGIVKFSKIWMVEQCIIIECYFVVNSDDLVIVSFQVRVDFKQ